MICSRPCGGTNPDAGADAASARERVLRSFHSCISPVRQIALSSGQLLPLPYNPEFSKTGEFLAYDDLRAWIAALERAGELKTIRTEVDPILEITEITDRVSKNAGDSRPQLSRRALPDTPRPQAALPSCFKTSRAIPARRC